MPPETSENKTVVLAHLPHACGIYIMRDASMEVIYVGKAIDLAKRVSHYFAPSRRDPKTSILAPLIRKIDYIPCASERESLLLERRLIRRFQPFFNSMWKDDKSYPYVKITLNEDYPRIIMTRHKRRDGALYFGPYPKAAMLKGLLRRFWEQRLFPLRPCKWNFSVERPLAPRKIKSCLYYHTRQCPAPCAWPYGQPTGEEKANLSRPSAASSRRKTAGKEPAFSHNTSQENYRRIAENAALFFRGKYADLAKEWEFEMKEASAAMDYERAARLRDNLAALRHMEERVRYEAVRAENLPSRLETSRGVTELQIALGLKRPPHHIEAFDISHFSGKQTVASMVCFKGGEPDKNHYRRFKIISVAGIDDFKSMKEVVFRRYRRLDAEGAALPDLVLIDGGKGQLAMAVRALSELKLKIPIASLAKRLEEVFVPERSQAILLGRDSPALQLLQRLRDEAHRFAVTYHKLLRKKRLLGG